ncbi:MAG: glycosyltransferase [Pseudomonadota bacterium]
MVPRDRQFGRISIFLPSLDGGGAEKVMIGLANGFAGQGLSVDLVVARAQGPRREEIGDGVTLIDLDVARIARAARPLSSYLRTARPEAFLSALTHANVVLVLAARLARYQGRIVVSERNSLTHLQAKKGTKARLRLALARMAYRASDGVIAVSEALATELQAFLGPSSPPVLAIPNPVDLDRITKRMTEPPGVALPCAPRNLVVAIGRLAPQKGFDVLLDAFAGGNDAGRHLMILGEGHQRAALLRRAKELGIADRLHLPGYVANPYAILGRAAVYVLSSRYEGMPNGLLDALASGCRVVSTDCPTGPREILRSPEDGILVPVEDARALGRAIDAAVAQGRTGRPDALLRRYAPGRIQDCYLDAILGRVRPGAELAEAI